MDMLTHMRAQAFNNAWANHRLLKACGQLSEDELAARRTNFFPSIVQTYNHNLTVDWFYVSSLEGNSLGYRAFEVDIPCPRFEQLDKEQHQIDRRLVETLMKTTEADLAKATLMLRRDDAHHLERTDRVLLHLFQHQIHHRGQVHAMLSGTNVKPPQLDEFYFDPFHDGFHHKDFVELGFTKELIWGATAD